MDEQKRELIKLIQDSDDDECIAFLLGCVTEFNKHREDLGVR